MSDTKKEIDINNPDIDDTGDSSERTRSWFLTLHIKNFENLGLAEDFYKDPPKIAKYLSNRWNESGKDRSCAVVICESAQGAYHAHMSCYCQGGITRSAVRELMGKAHCDAQRGTKKQLRDYMLKIGVHEQKGETVLLSLGLDNLKNPARTDLLEEAAKKINEEGYTLQELYREDIHYRRYDRELKPAYIDKCYQDTPLIKDMKVYWHCGKSGTGKTEVYRKLVRELGENAIYYYNNFKFGGLDKYVEHGCSHVLFIEELRPDSMSYGELLNLLSDIKTTQSHSRYVGTYHLWDTVHIASIFPPEEIYKQLVVNDREREINTFEQLRRRLTSIIYHYKNDRGEFKSYELPSSAYMGYKDIIHLAMLSEAAKENFSDISAPKTKDTIMEMDF